MIELHIQKLTEAVIRNNELLEAVLARTEPADVGAPAPAAPRTRKTKAKEEPVAEEVTAPEVEEPAAEEVTAPEIVEEPVTEEVAEPDAGIPTSTDFPTDRKEALNKIVEYAREVYAAAGDDLAAKQQAYADLRKEFGITKTPELTDDKLLPFYQRMLEVLA